MSDPRGSSAVLRVAVIGVGHLGSIHARILAQRAGAVLACVVDIDRERAAQRASELGCESMVLTPGREEELAAALAPKIDACIVAVPTVHHARVAVPLLKRRIACLVEKPIAANESDARELLDAARSTRTALAVGHVERFQPGLRKVRDLAVAPRFIECHRLAPFSFRSMDIGVVHDLMIHDLDLVLDLVGSPVASVDAAGGAILTEREDIASVRLVFENGARANVTASRASLSPMRRFRLFSSESYVSLDFHKNYGLIVKKGPRWEEARAELRTLEPAQLAARGDLASSGVIEIAELELAGEERPLQAELDSFLSAVREHREPEVTGDDGLRALVLAERIAAQIRQQSW
jgi:predicted dehydrogenase